MLYRSLALIVLGLLEFRYWPLVWILAAGCATSPYLCQPVTNMQTGKVAIYCVARPDLQIPME